MTDPEEPRDLVRSLDTTSDVLGLSAEPVETVDVVFDALCEAICRLTSIRRAVVFLAVPDGRQAARLERQREIA